jgi:hypothetical protein
VEIQRLSSFQATLVYVRRPMNDKDFIVRLKFVDKVWDFFLLCSDPDWILSSEFRPKLDASVGSNERGYVSLTSERLSRERDSRVRQREQLELVDEYAGCGSSEERKDVK